MGDFAVGAIGFGWFVAGLKTGWSIADRREDLGEPIEDSEEALVATTS